MADQISDITTRLTFTMDGDALDFAKTGRGVLVVEDNQASLPLPKGDKGDKGDPGVIPSTFASPITYKNRSAHPAPDPQGVIVYSVAGRLYALRPDGTRVTLA